MNDFDQPKRFDKLRFKEYLRFCSECPRIFRTKSRHAKVCGNCSRKKRSIKPMGGKISSEII